MRIEIATLFPEMCEAVMNTSVIGRAQKKGALTVLCHNIRDYTLDKQKRVDDAPYGGGMGMVMQADPIFRCYAAAVEAAGAVLMSFIFLPRENSLINTGRVSWPKYPTSFFYAATMKVWMNECWKKLWMRSCPLAILCSLEGNFLRC